MGNKFNFKKRQLMMRNRNQYDYKNVRNIRIKLRHIITSFIIIVVTAFLIYTFVDYLSNSKGTSYFDHFLNKFSIVTDNNIFENRSFSASYYNLEKVWKQYDVSFSATTAIISYPNLINKTPEIVTYQVGNIYLSMTSEFTLYYFLFKEIKTETKLKEIFLFPYFLDDEPNFSMAITLTEKEATN